MLEYLQNLAFMYENTSELTKKLDNLKTSPPTKDADTDDKSKLSFSATEPRTGVELMVSSEKGSVEKMMMQAFRGYLETYLRDEKAHLRERCNGVLNNFYDSKKHVKKAVGGWVLMMMIIIIRIIISIIIIIKLVIIKLHYKKNQYYLSYKNSNICKIQYQRLNSKNSTCHKYYHRNKNNNSNNNIFENKKKLKIINILIIFL